MNFRLIPKFLVLAFLILPAFLIGQVKEPIKILKPDTIKPKLKDTLGIEIDTASFWKDSLKRDDWKRDGDFGDDRAKSRPRRRKFKYRFSDRIQYSCFLNYPFTSSAAIPGTLLLHKFLVDQQNHLWQPSWQDDSTRSQIRKSMPKRILRTVLLDLTIETFLMELQQNIFGQYLRSFEFGMGGLTYSPGLPLPLGPALGNIKFQNPSIVENFSRQQIAQVASATMESSNLATEELTMRWMLRQGSFYREALHYLRNQSSLMAAIFSSGNYQKNNKNPFNNWLYFTNREYGHITSMKYDGQDLKRDFALATFTNPMLYNSLFNIIYSYIGQEMDSVPIFSINLGRNRWAMPWVRFNVTPFGPEWMPQIAITRNRQALQGYARIGKGPFTNSYGGGIKAYNLYRDSKLRLDAHASIWKQPYLFRNWINQQAEPIGWGGAFTVTGSYKIKNTENPMSLTVQAGFKTRGYLEGEVWNPSPILKIGLSFALDNDFEQEDVVPEYEFVPTRKEMRKKKLKRKNKVKKASPRTPK